MGEFKKVLSYRIILLITVNAVIGTGIFFLPGVGAKISGPSSILAWIVLSVSAIYTSMIFAELVSMYPKAGGVYEFSKQAYGMSVSFLIGWTLWIIANVTTAMLIVGGIQYLLPYESTVFSIIKLFICLAWVIIFNLMAYKGLKTSSVMLVAFSGICITVILMLVLPALFFAEPANLAPFFIHQGTFLNIAFIMLTVFFVAETFFGHESVLFLAEETKDAERVFPKALIVATTIICFLALALVVVSLMVVPYSELGSSNAPFSLMAAKMGGPVFAGVITIGTYLVILGAASSWIVSTPRLIMSLTRDKLFPPKFSMLHPIHGSPYNAIKLQAASTCILVIFGFSDKGYETLLSVLVPLELMMLCTVIVALLVLRFRRPDVSRPFRAPLAIPGSAILLLFYAGLLGIWFYMEHSALDTFKLCVSAILVGIPIYYYLLMQYNPNVVEKTNDFLAYPAYLTRNFNLPKKHRRKLISYLGDLKGKSIYEYGCSVGTLTMDLAKEMDVHNNLYATDISKKSIRIARRSIDIADHKHVWFIHDSLQGVRVHPNVPEVNAVISVSSLNYIEKVDTVLSQMNMRLVPGDPVAFLVYDKMYHLISNVNWLKNDSMIKHIFRRNGFLVNVKRDNGLLWQYVYIFGKKVMDSHMTEIEEIRIDDVLKNQREIKDIKRHMQDKLDDFKPEVMEKDVGVFLQVDRTFDKKTIFVNYRYFEEIIDFLLKIVLKYSLNQTGVHINFRKKEDSVQIVFSFHAEEHIVDLMTKLQPREKRRQEEDGDYVKALNSLIRLRKIIIEGYGGKIYIAESDKDLVAEIRPENHTVIFGEFDADEFNEVNQKRLNIDIEIPLTSLQKQH